ncbi:MAG TPA: ribonuclease III [Mycobacteriales bacterium]|jgi:ribonuclease-3|nr:ribonuclease III [Mycobacteriales bacterium]
MPEGEPIDGLIEIVGGDVDRDLIDLAITHRSYAYENGGVPTNERLEFLGDSVLGVVVTEELYRRYPDLAEGQLAKLRAAVVNARALAGVGRTINLGGYVKLGRGEESTGGRDKSSILADALEALIGAYYLDRGLEASRVLILRLFAAALEDAAGLGAGLDWKTSLQELAAERGLGAPEYAVEESGPDHAKSFRAVAMLAGAGAGEGAGNSKKEAEQRAAEQAWTALSAGPAGGAGNAASPPSSA